MSFCTTCGRQRTGTAPFCTGCGARFGDAAAAADGPDVPDSPAAVEQTRWDTRLDLRGEPAASLAPTEQSALPPPPPPVAPPAVVPLASVPPGPAPQPGPVPPYQAASGSLPLSPRRGGAGLLVALVIVLVLAVGGGAFALVSSLTGHKSAAQPSGQPTSTAPKQPTSPGTSAPATSPASATATPSSTASPAAPGVTVAVAPAAAGDPAAPRVQLLLERYFTAINSHDYGAYGSLLDAQMRQLNPPSTFASGYATTRDSAETLTGITDTGGGSLAATVSFTSHQSPADSINNSSCTAWTITLYLRPQGSGYLIGAPPADYQPAHQNCP